MRKTILSGVSGLLVAALATIAATPAHADIKFDGKKATGTIRMWKKGLKFSDPPTKTITVNETLPVDKQFGPYEADGLHQNTKVNVKAAKDFNGGLDTSYTVKGGDKIAIEDPELNALVSPVSEEAFGTLSLAMQTFGSLVTMSGSLFNSDAGVAQRLRFLDITDPLNPSVLWTQDYVGSGNWAINVSVSAPGGVLDNLVLRTDAALTSVPEPASLALLALGALAGLRRARRSEP